MAIIIKKRAAPPMPEPDEIVVEPSCNLVENDVQVRDIGVPTLLRCTVCGYLWRDPARHGLPLADCVAWQNMEAKKNKVRA